MSDTLKERLAVINYIYALIDPLTDEIRYVGKSNDYHQRLRHHIHNAPKLVNHRDAWINGLLKTGHRPETYVLEEVGANWQEAERFWIAYLKLIGCRLTNHADGGEGVEHNEEVRRKISKARRGMVFTPEHKNNLRLSQLGKKRSKEAVEKGAAKRRGIPLSDEHKRKIAEANIGRIQSEESRQKIRAAKLGRKLTPEHKERISNAGKGRVVSDRTREKMSKNRKGKGGSRDPKSEITKAKIGAANSLSWEVLSPNGQVYIIDNLTNFCQEHKLTKSNLVQTLGGTRKHHKGYIVLKKWKTAQE